MFLNRVFWQEWFNQFLWFLASLIKNGQLMHQSASCAHAPLRATAGHLPALSFPGVGHLPILRCPGAGHLPTPGLFPSCWHARGLLSKYNNTEDFTGKTSILVHLSRTGKKACSRFYACISSDCLSSQNYMAKSGAIDVNQRFWLLNQNSVDIIWKISFHIH